MAWSYTKKSVSIAASASHLCSHPLAKGEQLTLLKFDFTPLEFFGAAARCAHLHFVDPTLLTPEARLIAALVENHVDDTTSDFAILSSADSFKDFVKSYFNGTVAAGLAYLAMVRNGYVWADHFDNITGGNPNRRKKPDFVFSKNAGSIALMEAKGTRSQGRTTFDSRVEAGYLQQVEPHIGYAVNGITASHGYCIGSWMTSTSRAELIVHQTQTTSSPSSRPSAGATALKLVQQHNYASAMALALGGSVGEDIRRSKVRPDQAFLQFTWHDEPWITALSNFGTLARLKFELSPRGLSIPLDASTFPIFAINARVCTAVFQAFSGQSPHDEFSIRPVRPQTIEEARQGYQSDPSAVMPDGLAVFSAQSSTHNLQPVMWTGGQFVPYR